MIGTGKGRRLPARSNQVSQRKSGLKAEIAKAHLLFNIIYIIRSLVMDAKSLFPSTRYSLSVSPQRSLISKHEPQNVMRNDVLLNERCEPTHEPSVRYLAVSHDTSRRELADDL